MYSKLEKRVGGYIEGSLATFPCASVCARRRGRGEERREGGREEGRQLGKGTGAEPPWMGATDCETSFSSFCVHVHRSKPTLPFPRASAFHSSQKREGGEGRERKGDEGWREEGIRWVNALTLASATSFMDFPPPSLSGQEIGGGSEVGGEERKIESVRS